MAFTLCQTIIWGVQSQGFFHLLFIHKKYYTVSVEDPSLSSAKVSTVVNHELDPLLGFKRSYRLPYLVTLNENFPGYLCLNLVKSPFRSLRCQHGYPSGAVVITPE